MPEETKEENYFPDGFYTFYTTGPDGQRVATAEIAIINDELGYPEEGDQEKVGDIFPEGPITYRTRVQLEKYLHDQHGHAHLEFSGSGHDAAVQSEGDEPAQEEAPAPAEAGSASPAEPAGVADDTDPNEVVSQ